MVEELIRTFSGEARKPVMIKGSILEQVGKFLKIAEENIA